MELLFLSLFFVFFLFFCVYAKSDLYSHEYDAKTQEEIKTFNTNYNLLEKLDVEERYTISNDHIYNSNN